MNDAGRPLGGMSFPFRIEGGRVARRAGAGKLADDLRHLLSVRPGERVLLRDYGGGVQHRLQEPDDGTLRTLIAHEIEQAVRTRLPEARLTSPVRLRRDGHQLVVSFDYVPDPAGLVQRFELPLAAE
ncbi:GPW/gp25 family protein [Streptomyces sp. NPDC059010]|uniref:GPW/gp25 family protein n=1 Tax=Streptomyces sp. NPDC059010 TaxID=3346695 RepID=UPI0036BBE62B